jgi:hypothetical protein
MTMTTRTSTGSFFSTVVHHSGWCAARAPRLSRLSSACSVIQRDGYLPGRGVNTPPDAGRTRCVRLWPRAVQPSRFVRPQPAYPATGRRAASGGFARSGPGPCPAMLHYPEVGEVAWSTGLVVSIGSTGAAPAMSTAAGRPAGPAARPGSNGTMSPAGARPLAIDNVQSTAPGHLSRGVVRMFRSARSAGRGGRLWRPAALRPGLEVMENALAD